MRGTRQCRLDSDGACGSTGTEQQHATAGGVGTCEHGLHETATIGVLADEVPISIHHGVDGTDDGRGRRELIQMRENCDLVGK